MVSIIVPIYKAEKYLCRCLDSIANQTYIDWECILVDDGSPDNSGIICDSYANNNGKFKVIHQKNQGVSAARQKGLDNCIGQYVIHVDPDDWIEKNMLEDMMKHIELSNCDLLITDFYYEKKGKCIKSIQQPTDNDSNAVLHNILSNK